MSKHEFDAIEISIDEVLCSPYQPREAFEDEKIKELAASIKRVGLLQPPVVRLNLNGKYELIAGERRVRAAKLAGLTTLTVLLKKTHVQDAALASLIENVQRVSLNPMEVARSLKKLMAEFSYNQEELAEHVGKKRSTISNYLRLLSLSSSAQKALEEQKITMGHAKAILSIEDPLLQVAFLEEIQLRSLSVHEAEKLASKWTSKAKKKKVKPQPQDLFLGDIEKQLKEKLGFKLRLKCKKNAKKGSLEIFFDSPEDLEGILDLLDISTMQ